ncbi:MAG TPA: DUF192 domain-containing protein [Chloroflexota bacterium]
MRLLCRGRQAVQIAGVPGETATWRVDVPYRVVNSTRETVLAEHSDKAANPVRRGVGLIGRKGLPSGGGLIIQPCNSVVSFFMRFPIDVAFVNRDTRVVHMIHAMPPWRTSKIVRGAKLVVELPAGTLNDTHTELGDTLVIQET